MKKIIYIFFCIALGVATLTSVPDAYAKKTRATKKTAKKSTAKTSSQGNTGGTITLYYGKYSDSTYYVSITLYPSGRAEKKYYSMQYLAPGIPPDQWGRFKLLFEYSGYWKKDYRIIGNNQRQYYYEIKVDGESLYYAPGSNRLFDGIANFYSNNLSESYKLHDSPPKDQRKQYEY